jgi:desampylase
MTLQISSELLISIHEIAARTPHREVCGLLLGHGTCVTEIRHSPNVAPDPTCHFEVDPAQLIAAHKAARSGGPAVLGVWHSHPNGACQPSLEDARAAAPDGLFWLIVAKGVAGCWRAVAAGALQGRFDPVALAVL